MRNGFYEFVLELIFIERWKLIFLCKLVKGLLFNWVIKGFIVFEFVFVVVRVNNFFWLLVNLLFKVWVRDVDEFKVFCIVSINRRWKLLIISIE